MKTTDNHIFIGKEDKLNNWAGHKDVDRDELTEEEMGKLTKKVKELIKNYLQLDNVNFLFGTGSSIHLGAASIQNIPTETEKYILDLEDEDLKNDFKSYIEKLQDNMMKKYAPRHVRLAEPLMLDKQTDINNALVQFLAFVLGDYCTIYDKEETKDSVFQAYYTENTKRKEEKQRNQITIIDMSLLPFQVLETITGLVGRLVLEFLSRFDKEERGKMPVVIALEEAQNYIPENNQKDRDSISRKVFERIAREGRKYGLSLLVSSQRPSELSKTVLSQCNSFIVHRIQNPDDQTYIRKLVSAANSDLHIHHLDFPYTHLPISLCHKRMPYSLSPYLQALHNLIIPIS